MLTVRPACIDAPEMAQSRYGQQARAYLKQRLPIGREVTLAIKASCFYRIDVTGMDMDDF